MRRHGRISLAIAGIAAALLLVPAAAKTQSPLSDGKPPLFEQKPAWEKDVRQIMWRNRSCSRLGGFIWEVGTADKVITRDFSLTAAPPSEGRPVALHDVSAFVFAAYLSEKTRGELTPEQVTGLTLRSGFNAPQSQGCNVATTFGSCFGNLGGEKGRTGEKGDFYYGPGHAQKLVMDLGFGDFRDGDMRDEYSSALRLPPTAFSFQTTRIFDGLHMSPDNLSKFMRAILRGDLYMYTQLGRDAVCLDPHLCPAQKVLHAPAPRTRDYSIGHWVEKNPYTGGVDAYTALGRSGIYVWITADKKHYGYVIPVDDGINRTALGYACGRTMYRAVLRSTARPAPAR